MYANDHKYAGLFPPNSLWAEISALFQSHPHYTTKLRHGQCRLPSLGERVGSSDATRRTALISGGPPFSHVSLRDVGVIGVPQRLL
jgi:hypothetical protein